MALVLSLAKVAVGFARSRGYLAGDDGGTGGRIDSGEARETLARVREGRDQVQQLVTDLRDGKGKERLRGMVRSAVDRRREAAETDDAALGIDTAVTLDDVSDAEAELGLDTMMTALSGAAAQSGQSVDDLLDAYNAGADVASADQSAALLLRAILMAAKADGEIDDMEKSVIVDSLGATPEPQDLALVEELLAAPIDVMALAEATPNSQIVQVYTAAILAIRLDTPPEAVFLHRLAEALGIGEHVVNALHAQMGRPPLYRES